MKTGNRLLVTAAMISGLTFSAISLAGQGDGQGDCVCPDGGPDGKPMHHGMHGGMHGGDMMGGGFAHDRGYGRLLSKLNLSDEQQVKVDEIRKAARTEAKPLREALMANMQAERDAFEAGADESALKKLATKTAESRVDLMLYGGKTDLKIREILTPEQISQLDTLKAERRARWEEHRAKMKARMEAEE